MNKVLIVIKETYLRQVKSLAFLFMVLSPFLFIGLTAISGLAGASIGGNLSNQTALISQDKALIDELNQFGDYTTDFADLEAAEKALKDEKISAYLDIKVEDGQTKASYIGTEPMGERDKVLLSQALSNYQMKLNQEEADLSPEQGHILARQFQLDEHIAEDKSFEKIAQTIAFFALVMFMYMILITYSSMTAQEIANEKGTKIMEVIFSSVPAHLYFYGRILGILAVVATHVGIYALGGYLAYQFGQPYLKALGVAPIVNSVLGSLSINTLFFVIFGILIYVIFAALCGSLVTRMEDVNKAISPVMMMIMVAFFTVFSLGQSGTDHIIMKIGSFIPFFSTFFMPIRAINGYASGAETWLSLSILVLTTAGLVFYIGKSYAGLILQTDDLGVWKSFQKGMASK
ncbi:ABC transporter permease [Streptococcus rifensis]